MNSAFQNFSEVKVAETILYTEKKNILIKWTIVTPVYVPWFFVSSQQRFGAMDIKALGASQLSGLGQTVL